MQTTRPYLAIYVLWHPSYAEGGIIANKIREHFGHDSCQAAGTRRGVSILLRSCAPPGERTPIAIDWDEAEITAVVALVDSNVLNDPAWTRYVREIARAATDKGFPSAFFPVTVDDRGLEPGFAQQAIRWDRWEEPEEIRIRRLVSSLTHEFCRMFRHCLRRIQDTGEVDKFHSRLDKIKVFISHSKQDGEPLAMEIRSWMHESSPLASFLDVKDIPPGFPFERTLSRELRQCVFLAVHTDTYSSREWCRREVITAKRHLVPMMVVDCVRDRDPRQMSYLGNVPVVRLEEGQTERLESVVGCLLDEIFRNWLWLCQVGKHSVDSPKVLFTARPPELMTLAALPPAALESEPIVVYPEPLLSAEEERLLSDVMPRVRLQTFSEWLEAS